MSEEGSLTGIYERLGGMEATMREVKHTANNLSAKVDQLANIVATQGEIRAELSRVGRRQEANEVKIDSLEADRDKRAGAMGIAGWCIQNWPNLVGFVLIIGIILRANGKL